MKKREIYIMLKRSILKLSKIKSEKLLLILISSIFLIYCGSPGSEDTGNSPTSTNQQNSEKLLINVDPGNTVTTNKEILISAIIDKKLTVFPSQTYKWDFGDGMVSDGIGTVSVTHAYQKAGIYTIKLEITDLNNKTITSSTTVTVTGNSQKLPPRSANKPILELKFEKNNYLTDTSGNNLNAQWGHTGTGEFVEGVEGSALYLKGNKYLKVLDDTGKLSGLNQYTISFWFKHDTVEKNTMFIEKFDTGSNKYVFAAARHDLGSIRSYLTTSQSKHAGFWRLDDSKWHHFAIVYDSSLPNENLKIYFDQQLINMQDGDPVTPININGTMISSNAPLYIGANHEMEQFMHGCIDEIKIYDKALSTNELFYGFEIIHADIHARTGQYFIVKVPGEVSTTTSNKIYAEITGGNLSSAITLNDASDALTLTSNAGFDNLDTEEKILLKNRKLAGSENQYKLTVRLLTSTNAIIDEYSVDFYKPYNGVPEVGIDENNALRIKTPGYPDGKLFYPVTPYGLNDEDVIDWSNANYINSLHTQGFYPKGISLVDWNRYLNIKDSIKIMGPGAWDGLGSVPDKRSTNYYRLEEYVTTFKDHKNMLTWHWMDEPDLHNISPLAVRSWTYRSHKIDPQHPVSINFAGMYWAEEDNTFGYDRRITFEPKHNYKIFGKKTFAADILGFDYYPIEWAITKDASFSKLAFALDNMREENYNLIPYFSFVETCDVNDEDPTNITTPWGPNAAQLRMIIWLNVVHGAKGIEWFHYFTETPAENYAEMSKFTTQITDLAEVVLGPEVTRTVEVITPGGERIDTMVREYDNKIYIFAVRVSEMNKFANPATGYPDPVQNYTTTVTFKLDSTDVTVLAAPYDEARGDLTITHGGGFAEFTDDFAPYDVHIYVIPKS